MHETKGYHIYTFHLHSRGNVLVLFLLKRIFIYGHNTLFIHCVLIFFVYKFIFVTSGVGIGAPTKANGTDKRNNATNKLFIYVVFLIRIITQSQTSLERYLKPAITQMLSNSDVHS